MFDESWIALRHGAGAIKFRKVHKSSHCKRSCNSAMRDSKAPRLSLLQRPDTCMAEDEEPGFRAAMIYDDSNRNLISSLRKHPLVLSRAGVQY
jgi:hypothetical protein